jgi:type VI secretion system protein ImpG
MEVVSAAMESPDKILGRTSSKAESMIRIKLRCLNGAQLSGLRKGLDERSPTIDSLRFYLNGEWQLVYPLYEMLLNDAIRVELRPGNTRKAGGRSPEPISLAPSCLRPVGFEADEAMLPYTARSFPGYRLLSEYFAFPDKFLFFDLTGLDQAAKANFGEEWDIVIYVRENRELRANLDMSIFQLGCSPIINLFDKVAEPIRLTQQQYEYQLVPDVHRQMATEVYSIDSVTSVDASRQQVHSYQPFYSNQHAAAREKEGVYWFASRRPSERKDDPGTELYLSLVNMNFNPELPATETLTLQVTCTNRDLPGRLPFGGREGDFEMEGGRGISKVRCLRKPTNTLRPPLKHATHWRLLSHLILNPLSITGSGMGADPDALREILLLYDFMDSSATRKQIQGIQQISSRRVVRQMMSLAGTTLIRGIETTIEFDEEQFVGSGVFLFASVLEIFLGLYASLNSFSQLVARTRQKEDPLKRWPPRAGVRIVL